jgi:predicted Zn-dependent peptidase
MRLFISTLAILLFSISSIAQNRIEVRQLTLENGLKVYLHEDHTQANVFGAVITRAGGKNDPADATGMAHYMEHMLFKGTTELGTTDWEKEKPHIDKIFELYDELGKTTDEEKRKEIQKQINEESLKAAEYAIPNEMSNVIKSMGGTNLNAGTGPDQTMYYNSFPPSQIERWLDLYAHRFINPVFRSFQAELEVVYEEKNMYQDMFVFPILEKFNYHFFKNHPYGQQTLIGTAEDLKNPSLTKMYDFYKTYYVPNNMALVISGDFNSEDIIPIIEEKFGKWESGEVPEYKIKEEEAFNGRELVEVKMSPIKMGFLGFRTLPKGHKDELILKAANMILANSNQTGLLDKLVLDNEILAAEPLNMPYIDHGVTIFLFIPKIIGQKLDEAENLIISQVDSLKAGKFEDWMLQAIKNDLYKSYQKSMESNTNKALEIANSFLLNKNPNDYLNSFTEKINSISKQDIIDIANKYYGNNYLAFYSKMGSAKKDKIDKPGYEPLKANTNAKSAYTERFEDIPFTDVNHEFIDFDRALNLVEIPGAKVYTTENPVNDIFSLTIKYGVGKYEMPMIDYAAQLMDLAETEDMDLNEIKKQFAILGCNYSFNADDSYLYLNMSGIEENLREALALMDKLLNNIKLEQKRLNVLISAEKTNRKMERSEADNVASALFSYVAFKEKSSYLNRLSMKEIKKLQADDLVDVFKKAMEYEAEVHFVGKTKEVANLLGDLNFFKEDAKESNSPIEREIESYENDKVFFVHKRKARQSKIYYLAKSENYKPENSAKISAFNSYFGGGFSGIVLQEVREYRSLAYTAGANMATPDLINHPMYFVAYIGTQADKTSEGLHIFDSLIRNMPQKPERMDMIKDYLVLSSSSYKPSFRRMSQQIVDWQLRGYNQDPRKTLLSDYENLEFDDIVEFYNKYLKSKNLAIAIVGNKRKINHKEFKNYGEVVKIKEKKLFTK